jgi:hypothetical protein
MLKVDTSGLDAKTANANLAETKSMFCLPGNFDLLGRPR